MELGIPVVSPVRCLNLAEQVAQNLQACNGPAAAGRLSAWVLSPAAIERKRPRRGRALYSRA